jgi:hypothetical protein
VAWGQKDSGSIVGTVTDSSGAVVTKAKIVVADLDRGTNLETPGHMLSISLLTPTAAGRMAADFCYFIHPEWGYDNADFDVRHRFVFSYLYELPIGNGKSLLGNASGGPIKYSAVGKWAESPLPRREIRSRCWMITVSPTLTASNVLTWLITPTPLPCPVPGHFAWAGLLSTAKLPLIPDLR